MGFMTWVYHLNGSYQVYWDCKKHARFRLIWNQCWFAFLITKALPKWICSIGPRQWIGNSIMMFWAGFENKLNGNILRSEPTKCDSLFITYCASVFNCYKHDTAISHLLTIPTQPPINYLFVSKIKMKLKRKTIWYGRGDAKGTAGFPGESDRKLFLSAILSIKTVLEPMVQWRRWLFWNILSTFSFFCKCMAFS